MADNQDEKTEIVELLQQINKRLEYIQADSRFVRMILFALGGILGVGLSLVALLQLIRNEIR
ncbi:MAG: hypothetical protein GY795_37230 [Desulfobacterales bacterium]|nr:hypothetical protein [Desulfobacterales bacterium]